MPVSSGNRQEFQARKREETVTGRYDDTIGGRSTEYVSVGVSVSHVGIGIGIRIILLEHVVRHCR